MTTITLFAAKHLGRLSVALLRAAAKRMEPDRRKRVLCAAAGVECYADACESCA